MGERKKWIWAFLALTLGMTLLLSGCQSAVVNDIATQKTNEETEKASETARPETEGGEKESPKYIDADYVDANYEDGDEDDLSKYKTGGGESQESGNRAGKPGSAKDGETDSESGTAAGGEGDEASDPARGSQNGDDWDGNWDDWIAEQDQYRTDPVPDGKPEPVEPQDEQVDTSTSLTCTLSVECSTILNNMGDLTEGKEDLVPSDGVIYGPYTVTFYQGESVYDVLLREMQSNRIHMEAEFTPMYNSAYVQGINNLYEKDCGSLSGWMYCVNGWFPNYGCSRYQLQDGDVVEWRYTCDLGRDLGRE